MISGLVGGCALSWATMAGQAASSSSRSGRPAAAAAVGRRRERRRRAASAGVGRSRAALAGAASRRGPASSAPGLSAARARGSGVVARLGVGVASARRGRGGRGWPRLGLLPRARRRRPVAAVGAVAGVGRRRDGSWPARGRRCGGGGRGRGPATAGAGGTATRTSRARAGSGGRRCRARFGSIAASRRPAAARAARSWRAVAGSAMPAVELDPDGSTAWSRSARMSRPRSSSSSRSATPAAPSPSTRAIDEARRRPRRRPGRAGRGRSASSIRSGADGQELVEHRLGVAHAAGGEPGDEVDGGRIGLRPSAARIRASLPSISATVRRRTS